MAFVRLQSVFAFISSFHYLFNRIRSVLMDPTLKRKAVSLPHFLCSLQISTDVIRSIGLFPCSNAVLCVKVSVILVSVYRLRFVFKPDPLFSFPRPLSLSRFRLFVHPFLSCVNISHLCECLPETRFEESFLVIPPVPHSLIRP